MTTMNYDPKKTISKAMWQGMGTAALVAALQIAADMPTDFESLKKLWPALLAGMVAAAVKSAANYYKNSERGQIK